MNSFGMQGNTYITGNNLLLMKYSNDTSTQCYAYQLISELVSCAFSTIPFYLLVSTLFLLVFMHVYLHDPFSAHLELTY